MKFKKNMIPAITVFMMLLSMSAIASTTRFSLLYTRPVSDAGAFFTVADTHTLQHAQLNIGTALDYAYRPLTGTSSGTTVDITRYYVAGHLFAAMGTTDWLHVYADMPYLATSRFVNPDSAPFPAPTTATKLGDLELGAKLRVLDLQDFPIGLAIIPMLTVPTGDQTTFMGDDGVTGGGRVALDGKPASWLQCSVNVGGLARKHVQSFGLDFGSQFLLSAALRFNVAPWAALVAEASSRTPFANFYSSKTTSPTDFLGGVQWRVGSKRPLLINTSVGYATPYGSGAPQFRSLASVSYAFAPLGATKQKTPIVMAPATAWQPIFFGFGSTKISHDAAATLGQVASDLKKSPRPVVITGHTDNRGRAAVNQRLSLRRAQAVQRYLKKQNISTPDMTTIGDGERSPAASNRSATGRAQNRRVDIH